MRADYRQRHDEGQELDGRTNKIYNKIYLGFCLLISRPGYRSLVYTRQNAVQFIQAAVADNQLSLATGLVFQQHRRTDALA